MDPDSPKDQSTQSRIFLHPTENQLWANSSHQSVPQFPKFNSAMLAVCDQTQYESLVERLANLFKSSIHIDNIESSNGNGSCFANILCIASLGICFCPFLYWTCKKNKEKPNNDNQFESAVSATVDKHTEDWSGKLSIERGPCIHTHGE